jgi:hypothetical protein
MTARRLAVTALLVVASAGCTGSTTTPTSPASTSSSGPTVTESPIPSGPITFVPGEFQIIWADVEADLTWNGGAGELRVTNDSTTPLGPPGLYAVTDASTKVSAKVEPAQETTAGDDGTFTVTFPDSLNPDDAGLLILSFGNESWGAMQPLVKE